MSQRLTVVVFAAALGVISMKTGSPGRLRIANGVSPAVAEHASRQFPILDAEKLASALMTLKFQSPDGDIIAADAATRAEFFFFMTDWSKGIETGLATSDLAAQQTQIADRRLTESDIMTMAQNGVGDFVIIDSLRTRGCRREPSPDNLSRLKESGVGEKVLKAMRQFERRSDH